MALKHKIEKLEDVPEPAREFYEAGTGGFFLQVEGMVPKAHLDEFRTNNITLANKVKEFETNYKDVDVAKYREMLAMAGKTPKEIEDAVTARVKQLTDEHEGVVADLTGKLASTTTQLNTVLVDGTLKTEAAKSGVLATALDDVVLRGRTVFQTVEGKLVAKGADGQPLYDKDGTSPLAVGTWLKELKKTAPHLFEGMKGAGGQGNNGNKGGPVDTTKMNATQKIAHGLNLLNSSGT